MVAYPSEPAQYGLVWAPLGPTSIAYLIVLTVFEGNMLQGHTNIHGQYFDAEASPLALQV